MSIVDALATSGCVVAAELRPPRAELDAATGLDAWIDTYHAVRGLTQDGTFVCLTDGAVGLPEEDNLRHLVTNLGADAPRDRVVPFLTCKHSLEYCLSYAHRAVEHGFPALVVLGGDRHAGVPRCVDHAWQLRALIRARHPRLRLGGWANPHAPAEEQVRYLQDPDLNADFFLTQVVSHHDVRQVDRLLDRLRRAGVTLPGMFGVFYYRSARSLSRLARLLPVPATALAAEFGSGQSAEDICARSIRRLAGCGVRHFYISNLPIARARPTLRRIVDRLSLPTDDG